jgi:phenylalanyl-tRNA synthetase beta chain
MGNPLNAEAGVLRPSLGPGMTAMLAHNLHRDVNAARLFELGTVFGGSAAEVKERMGLALGATGPAVASPLYGKDDALFAEVKGTIQALLGMFAGVMSFDGDTLPAWIAPGRGARARLDGEVIAVFGELNAEEMQRRKLRQNCVVATIDAQRLLGRPLPQIVTRDLSRFQAVERDFSFIFADAVGWQRIEAALRGLELSELRQVAPVEIFRDPKGRTVATGSYSLLTRVVFQSGERTLTEEELTSWSELIIAALKDLGGAQRA